MTLGLQVRTRGWVQVLRESARPLWVAVLILSSLVGIGGAFCGPPPAREAGTATRKGRGDSFPYDREPGFFKLLLELLLKRGNLALAEGVFSCFYLSG
jgi:hypothetical protein